MKVILLKELKGRGGEGDVIEVARGFAVNKLFPDGIAIEATPGALKQLEQRKGNIAKREAGRLTDANAIQAALEGQTVKVIAKVGDEGQLFGSVTAANIAAAITEQLGIEADKRKIDLKTPIKKAGIYEVVFSIYRDIKATVKVDVNSEKAFAKAAAEAAAAEAAEVVEEAAEAVEEAAE